MRSVGSTRAPTLLRAAARFAIVKSIAQQSQPSYVPPPEDPASEDLAQLRPVQQRVSSSNPSAPIATPSAEVAGGDGETGGSTAAARLTPFNAEFVHVVLPVLPPYAIPLCVLGHYLEAVHAGRPDDVAVILCGGAAKVVGATSSGSDSVDEQHRSFKSRFGSLRRFLSAYRDALLSSPGGDGRGTAAHWLVRRRGPSEMDGDPGDGNGGGADASGIAGCCSREEARTFFEHVFLPFLVRTAECKRREPVAASGAARQARVSVTWREVARLIADNTLAWPPPLSSGRSLALLLRLRHPPSAPAAWSFFGVVWVLEEFGFVAVRHGGKGVLSISANLCGVAGTSCWGHSVTHDASSGLLPVVGVEEEGEEEKEESRWGVASKAPTTKRSRFERRGSLPPPIPVPSAARRGEGCGDVGSTYNCSCSDALSPLIGVVARVAAPPAPPAAESVGGRGKGSCCGECARLRGQNDSLRSQLRSLLRFFATTEVSPRHAKSSGGAMNRRWRVLKRRSQ